MFDMSYDFLVGPNGVEEVEMNEIEDDAACTPVDKDLINFTLCEPKIDEAKFLVDLSSSDSEQGTDVKYFNIDLFKSEDTSEIESKEVFGDETSSSISSTQSDSDSKVEIQILESNRPQIAQNLVNFNNQLPPPLEFGPWKIDPKTLLDVDVPILRREEKLDIPLDEFNKDNTTDPELQPSNQYLQKEPKLSLTIKRNKNKRKWGFKKNSFPSRQPRTCPVEGCGKVLGNLYALNIHMEMQHTKATCQQCDLTFDRIILLTNHMNDMHTPEDLKVFKKKAGRKPQPKPEIPPPPPCYPCTKCPSTFTYSHGLTRHLRSVHGDVFKSSSCYFCSREFFSYFELSAHMHIHTLETAHNCCLCGKGFSRKSTLQGHMASVHAPKGSRAPKPKKYLCSICGKGFGGSGNLKYHVEDVHLKLKAFGCDLCEAKFGRKGSLDKHKLAVHDNKRDFVCDRCGKGFSTNVLLKVHVEAVHEKTRHQCPNCEKNYSQRTHMLAHIKKAHK